ncbi:Holo-[acyl-carrier protein] synthase [Sulfurimonas gotlandica GD1]|jgi:holo-[acyl-carrier protein] synthase|uniref:Holo-[acyl-carrier-protein] synthase n=1 Tax=Sulfurimonas gotlandica (strain DSM 19862 / JCM 16533 / GD1) TaxID=929558 RepID=H1FSW8_SULGG|nr:holo-ACP synthase [Sulfurimonas gotlandica]EHP28704.1 Holo-[acyl-carrier protein] synthase [Sulfurimonas gotlandica GD1]
MIGVDLIKTSRMNRLIERFGEKALLRFLSPEEIKLVKNYKTASGFWAVKEAVSKALGVGIGKECAFEDIKISKTERGAPKLELSQKLIDNFNIADTSVSITHDGEYAIAVVAIQIN